MTDQTATQKVLIEMVERYEAMFAHYTAIRKVLGQPGNLAALQGYAALVLDLGFLADVHAKFGPLKAGIAAASQDSQVLALIEQIPLAPKVQ